MLLFQSLFLFLFFKRPQNLPSALQIQNFLILRKDLSSCRNHSHSLCYTQGPQQTPANATARPAPVLSPASFSRANVQRPCALQTASCQWLLLPGPPPSQVALSFVLKPPSPSPSPPPLCTLLPRPAALSLSYTQFVSGAALPYPRSAANPLPARPQ